MKKNKLNDDLFKELFDSDDDDSKEKKKIAEMDEKDLFPSFPVQLTCELPYPNLPIPGLLVADKYFFDVTPEMVDSGERLRVKLEKWKLKNDIQVAVEIHHAKTKRYREIVHYVQLKKTYLPTGHACSDREYAELRKYIRSLPQYQRLPP